MTSAGVKSAGTKSAGVESAGVEPAGVEPAGVEPAGTATGLAAQQPTPAPSPDTPADTAAALVTGEQIMCDVLTTAQFGGEVTNVLLDWAPNLTAAQIVQIRALLLQSAVWHGWIED